MVEVTLAFNAKRHHMKLPPSIRHQAQAATTNGRYPTVMVDAFGLLTVRQPMIDVPASRCVWSERPVCGTLVLFATSERGPFTLVAACNDGTIIFQERRTFATSSLARGTTRS